MRFLTRSFGRRAVAALLSGAAVLLLSGCAGTNPSTTYDSPTVRPGETVTCENSPCTVFFETPEGSGTHTIFQNGTVKAGVAVGGKRVSLGQYYGGSYVFHVEGTDLPKAYLEVIRAF